MSDVGLILNILLGVLLVAALAVGWRLERRLKALRDSHQSFAKAVEDLDRAAARAEQGLADLRGATDEASETLAQRIDKAGALSTRLAGLIERGENAAARVPSRAEPLLRELAAAPRAAPVRPAPVREEPLILARATEPARAEAPRPEPVRPEPVRAEQPRVEPRIIQPRTPQSPEQQSPELRSPQPQSAERLARRMDPATLAAAVEARMDLMLEEGPRRLSDLAAAAHAPHAPVQTPPGGFAHIAPRVPEVRSRARVDEDLFDDTRALRAGGRA